MALALFVTLERELPAERASYASYLASFVEEGTA